MYEFYRYYIEPKTSKTKNLHYLLSCIRSSRTGKKSLVCSDESQNTGNHRAKGNLWQH